MKTDSSDAYFKGRTLLIATSHRKEEVLIPVLKDALHIFPFVPEDFNSDAFGTFTGEVERPADPLTTLRRKCRAAMEAYQSDLAIASEGSFGPHPDYPFLAAGEEWLMLIDSKNHLEITVREISAETNYHSKIISDESELMAFAAQAGFPQHGLILRAGPTIFKGIQEEQELRQFFGELKKSQSTVTAETDMRALFNPTRMRVIERLAGKLRDKILCACPTCGAPGFAVIRVEPGLPCAWCWAATSQAESLEYGCQVCEHSEIMLHPEGKTHADPAFCDLCNP